MSTEPKKTRAKKAPAAKTPATETPVATPPAPAAKPAAASAGPQGLLMAGVVIIIIALAAIVWLIATGRGAPAPVNNMAEAKAAKAATPAMPNRGQLLPSGLRIETIREGNGPLITAADTPLVRYELRVLGSGGVVQSNFADPRPAPLSPQGVIPGFAEALTHMRPGGEARFWVPPSLGYGAQTPPGAPFGPNDILEFRVRVEGLAPAGRAASPAGGNTISEADLQNMIAAMNAAEAAGGR
jgi:FKBP-type peptidyl-prolyl cis-trans isomerase